MKQDRSARIALRRKGNMPPKRPAAGGEFHFVEFFVLLSGTDSLGFWFARDNELYDRERTFHTTFIPYREHSRLLDTDSIDEYICYGGPLRKGEADFDDEELKDEGVAFRDDESTRRYIDTAICKNIQHSLAYFEHGRYFGHLRSLYEAGELTGPYTVSLRT